MGHSNSFGNKLSRFTLAVTGAEAYSGDLPRSAIAAAQKLRVVCDTLPTLNGAQEQAKIAQKASTRKVGEMVAEGDRLRRKIVGHAEAEFGKRDDRMRHFRPSTEGKVSKRVPKAQAK